MLNGARFVSLAAVLLALAGCGSTKKATTTATTTSVPPGPPVATTTYSASLAGTSEIHAGAPKGSALALIGINGSSHELCFTFSDVKNIKPTAAYLEGNIKIGRTYTPLGRGYQASGCQQASAILLRLIEREPHKFQVALMDRLHPLRIVHGPL